MNNVLIVSKKKEHGDALAKLIRPLRFDKIEQTDSAQDAKRRTNRNSYSLVLINTPLSHQLGTDLALDLWHENGPDIVIIVKNDLLAGVEGKLSGVPVFIVPKPVNRQSLLRDIRYILNRRRETEILKQQNDKLRKRMESLKYQYRAKLCLMENLKMPEEEAHRYLQKKAMDEQRNPEEIAKAIIKLYQKE